MPAPVVAAVASLTGKELAAVIAGIVGIVAIVKILCDAYEQIEILYDIDGNVIGIRFRRRQTADL